MKSKNNIFKYIYISIGMFFGALSANRFNLLPTKRTKLPWANNANEVLGQTISSVDENKLPSILQELEDQGFTIEGEGSDIKNQENQDFGKKEDANLEQPNNAATSSGSSVIPVYGSTKRDRDNDYVSTKRSRSECVPNINLALGAFRDALSAVPNVRFIYAAAAHAYNFGKIKLGDEAKKAADEFKTKMNTTNYSILDLFEILNAKVQAYTCACNVYLDLIDIPPHLFQSLNESIYLFEEYKKSFKIEGENFLQDIDICKKAEKAFERTMLILHKDYLPTKEANNEISGHYKKLANAMEMDSLNYDSAFLEAYVTLCTSLHVSSLNS